MRLNILKIQSSSRSYCASIYSSPRALKSDRVLRPLSTAPSPDLSTRPAALFNHTKHANKTCRRRSIALPCNSDLDEHWPASSNSAFSSRDYTVGRSIPLVQSRTASACPHRSTQRDSKKGLSKAYNRARWTSRPQLELASLSSARSFRQKRKMTNSAPQKKHKVTVIGSGNW